MTAFGVSALIAIVTHIIELLTRPKQQIIATSSIDEFISASDESEESESITKRIEAQQSYNQRIALWAEQAGKKVAREPATINCSNVDRGDTSLTLMGLPDDILTTITHIMKGDWPAITRLMQTCKKIYFVLAPVFNPIIEKFLIARREKDTRSYFNHCIEKTPVGSETFSQVIRHFPNEILEKIPVIYDARDCKEDYPVFNYESDALGKLLHKFEELGSTFLMGQDAAYRCTIWMRVDYHKDNTITSGFVSFHQRFKGSNNQGFEGNYGPWQLAVYPKSFYLLRSAPDLRLEKLLEGSELTYSEIDPYFEQEGYYTLWHPSSEAQDSSDSSIE